MFLSSNIEINFMKAIGNIYRPLNDGDEPSFLRRILRESNFRLWTTTASPGRDMISYGGRDSLDNEICLQGYFEVEGERERRVITLYATGRDLIKFMDELILD